MVQLGEESQSKVYFSAMVSPSYTSAVAQVVQMAGVSGARNNTILFDCDREKPDEVLDLSENFGLVKTRGFDVMILGVCPRKFGYRRQIDVWLSESDHQNLELMVLTAYVLLGHPDWSAAHIRIHAIVPKEHLSERREEIDNLIHHGRLPISPRHVRLIGRQPEVSTREIINEYSAAADLTMVGFRGEQLARERDLDLLSGYPALGNMLFVNTDTRKHI